MEKDYRIYTGKSEFDKAIHVLEGILKSISFDSVINETEIFELNNWINLHSQFSHKQPFKDVFRLLDEILEDNIVTSEERDDLLWFCSQVTTKVSIMML